MTPTEIIESVCQSHHPGLINNIILHQLNPRIETFDKESRLRGQSSDWIQLKMQEHFWDKTLQDFGIKPCYKKLMSVIFNWQMMVIWVSNEININQGYVVGQH